MTPSVNAWKRHASAPSRTVGAVAAGALVVAGLTVSTTPAAVAAAAPDGPGAMSHFDLARKDCLGTARNSTSKVWFTVANGVLSDVYYPTIDNTNNETLQFVVTDGSHFTDLQTRDMTYQVSALDDSGMACRVTSTAKSGRYTLTTDYFTDPQRAQRGDADQAQGLQGQPAVSALRAVRRHDQRQRRRRAPGRTAAPTTPSSTPAPGRRSRFPSTPSPRPPRRTATTPRPSLPRCAPTGRSWPPPAASPAPPATAWRSSTPTTRLATTYANATQGNVVQTAQLDVRGGRPRHPGARLRQHPGRRAGHRGRDAPEPTPDRTLSSYQRGWKAYDKQLESAGERRGLPRRAAQAARAHLLPVRECAEGQRGQDVPGRRRRVAGQPVGSGRRRG